MGFGRQGPHLARLGVACGCWAWRARAHGAERRELDELLVESDAVTLHVALNDVFDTEPLPPNHPLTRLDNVVLTPHIGWPTDHAYELFSQAAADVLLAWLDNRPFERFTASH